MKLHTKTTKTEPPVVPSKPSRFKVKHNIVFTEEQLEAVVEKYLAVDEFVFDLETRGEHRGFAPLANVSWIALCCDDDTVDVIPMGHPNGDYALTPWIIKRVPRRDGHGELILTPSGRPSTTQYRIPPKFAKPPKQLRPQRVFEALKPVLFGNARKIGHNVRFDLSGVAKYYDGEVPPGPYGDTATLVHCTSPALAKYSLESLVTKFLDGKYDDGKLGPIGVDCFSLLAVARYAALDARFTWQLWKMFSPKLALMGVEGVYAMEMDLMRVLLDVERHGAPVDKERMWEIDARIIAEMDQLEAQLYEHADEWYAKRVRELQKQHDANPDDVAIKRELRRTKIQARRHKTDPWKLTVPAQRGWFVYTVCGHKAKYVTEKTGAASTKAVHLEAYAKRDKRVAAMARWMKLKKIKSTYIDAYAGRNKKRGSETELQVKLIRGRLHPSFLQWGTRSGRLSCVAPNLQNLPRHDEDEPEISIRSLFIAPPGYKLIVADYDQIELRMIAHFSGDKTMIRYFTEGIDIHLGTAASILGKDPEDVTKEERTRFGKVPNFAMSFGAGPQTVAAQARIPVSRAKKVLAIHEERFPAIGPWKQSVINQAIRSKPPHVRTISGRIRWLYELYSPEPKVRSKAMRQAVNTRVQGSAGDVLKLAMIRTHEAFEGHPYHIMLTVHDELVCCAPDKYVEDARERLVTAMTNPYDNIRVPLTVEANIGERWSVAK